ncbi:aminodeoxychorismate/anthranilate synthase component II [Alphaproteobacteria bacterium]|nr:aminodeoxychorismate/anthranilate synthase component II [Alphaproteobacteria bacterium]
MTFLIIDNYDSFVHNLARYFEIAGVKTLIKRNDEITIDEIKTINPTAIILSPGPCKPTDAGICMTIVKQLGPTTPTLGVCLGHQAIAESYGAETIKSQSPLHGRASAITHKQTGLFANIPTPIKVGRYHSLTNQVNDYKDLIVTALTDDNIVMSIAHKTHPVYGVQFHPESILTEYGQEMIQNFINIATDFNTKREAA